MAVLGRHPTDCGCSAVYLLMLQCYHANIMVNSRSWDCTCPSKDMESAACFFPARTPMASLNSCALPLATLRSPSADARLKRVMLGVACRHQHHLKLALLSNMFLTLHVNSLAHVAAIDSLTGSQGSTLCIQTTVAQCRMQ